MRPQRALWGVALVSLAAALGCSDDSTTIVDARRYSAFSDSTFAVGDAAVLEVNNFAGTTTVIPGAANEAHIAVERWAANQSDLDAIEVAMVALANGVRITTTNPAGLSRVGVDLDATIPPDMQPRIETGAGEIRYRGPALGESRFAVAAGNITLRLPSDVDVELSLTASSGFVRVDFPVVGQVTERTVQGVIGTGADGKIIAQVGAGNIVVKPE